MSAAWLVVVAVGIGTVAIKAAGPLVLGSRKLPVAVERMMSVLAPALLCALVATQTLGGNHRLVIDARIYGIAAASVAILLRAPLLVTIVLAAVVTATVRALTGGG